MSSATVPAANSAAARGARRGGRGLPIRHGAVWAVVGLVLFHAGLLGFLRMNGTAGRGELPEIALGDFEFRDTLPGDGPIARAQFSLHITLLGGMESSGRSLLALRQYKVQEAVEQLLRQAHGKDFEDPRLLDLKRQLQVGINEAIGTPIVGEVILTGLALERNDRFSPSGPSKAASETVSTTPGY